MTSPTVMSALVRERQTKLRTAMSASESGLCIACSPANVVYASGYRSIAHELYEGHHVVVICSPERIVLVAPANDSMAFLREEAPECELVPYGAFYISGSRWRTREIPQPCESLEDAIREALQRIGGARQNTVIDVDVSSRLGSIITGASVQPRYGAGWWEELRREKLPSELDMLERAAKAAEAGIAAGIAALRHGISEAEVAAEVGAAILHSGGIPKLLSVTFGEASASGDVHASPNIHLSPRETARLDIGCVVDGYWADTARCAVLGEPTEEQLTVYSALLHGQAVELSLVAAGNPVGMAAKAAIEAVRDAGIPDYERHHVGHGIGLRIYEPPLVTETNETTFAPGMVMCIETPYYRAGWGGLMIEDTVVVASDGCQHLTRLSKDFAVVPI